MLPESAEASFALILENAENSWKNLEFILLSYKDKKDVFILGSTDQIQENLDDCKIKIEMMATSKCVHSIKTKVDEWEKKIDLINNTLESWKSCQDSWLYLENIFSSPNIVSQLPTEAEKFSIIDKSWKEIMCKVSKNPLAIEACTQLGLLEIFQNNIKLYDEIMKCLETYLNRKRDLFPRLYFLSTDELMKILSTTRNPDAIQPYLLKCFDAIHKLESKGNEIIGMISPQGEKVSFDKEISADGNMEEYLSKVEESMISSLKKLMKNSLEDFENCEREEWMTKWQAQIILTISQTMWCKDLTKILDGDFDRVEALKDYEKKSLIDLSSLAKLVRTDLPELYRLTLASLIVIKVHAKDVVEHLINSKVDNKSKFEWLSQLRYYWDNETDCSVVRISNSMHMYGYEYLGASSRLVITPLSDRCHLSLMSALELNLGGAPMGPAGTGKTETVKDLAKSFGKRCLVYNCSDQIDYKIMGRLFTGLVQTGSWSVFDEFNRINIEVMSVVAQQLTLIRNAKTANLKRFTLEDREVNLIPTCGIFITMNPGYAGRTELPSNLKKLFRPITMMIPDYKLISEVLLYSKGFENCNILSRKIVQMFKLCSEQLSRQDHYDFGMRAVMSVVTTAGKFKRENPEIAEDLVLIKALKAANLPKFTAEDAILFNGIIQDLFPDVQSPVNDNNESLENTILNVLEKRGLQKNQSQVKKAIQFYKTLLIKHGVVLIGSTGGGKTTIYNILANALSDLYATEDINPFYRPVHNFVLNPKALKAEELYGSYSSLNNEWKDGLITRIFRQCAQDTTEDHKWIICDGPLDAIWVENLNTVLDDNKVMCLANGDRIKFTKYMHMIFEVQDLACASPATVSRCGMVYIDSNDLGYMPYVRTWIKKFQTKFGESYTQYLLDLFTKYTDDGLNFVNKNCKQTIKQVDIGKVSTLCSLLDSLLTINTEIDSKYDEVELKARICTTFMFCYVWAIGGNLDVNCWNSFDTFVRTQFKDNSDAKAKGLDVFSYFLNVKHCIMNSWQNLVPRFYFNPNKSFYELTVPTIDTQRYGYLMELLLSTKKSVLFTGETGTGKSVIARETLNTLSRRENYLSAILNFSHQTSSKRTQDLIEGILEKRRKNVLGAPNNMHQVLFIDDINMPKLTCYGAQPAIELLRQCQDFGGFYSRTEEMPFIEIKDMTISAACCPPGGGRNVIPMNMMRHFSIFSIPTPNDNNLNFIFKSFVEDFFDAFNSSVRESLNKIVEGAVDIYSRLRCELLPTPSKPHYIFNLRDLSKFIQGILKVEPKSINDKDDICKLFCHETQRVFHDRLINVEDKKYFHNILSETTYKFFGQQIEPTLFNKNPIIFCDFIKIKEEPCNKLYENIPDYYKLRSVLQEYQKDFNIKYNKKFNLVFFNDAIEHISRIIRIIQQENGHALLVGISGTGKKSLTRIASYICGYECFQIELSSGYNYQSFHYDLKALYVQTVAHNKKTVFLLPNSQILMDEFLEDINTLLNGEIPHLFYLQEYGKVLAVIGWAAEEAGIKVNDQKAFRDFIINRVRTNLHVVLCMSPVGDTFRQRLRKYPSLVNCFTIDWFENWSSDALLSVARNSLFTMELTDGQKCIIDNLSQMCVKIHTSVSSMTERFYDELRRYYYTTPTLYLELIELFKSILIEKKNEISSSRQRVVNGLEKLIDVHKAIKSIKIEKNSPRLKRAMELTTALAIEKNRWEESIEFLNKEMSDLFGNVLISAASVVYNGAFPSNYRKELVKIWTDEAKKHKLPISDNLSIIKFFTNQSLTGQWNTDGLPGDEFSTENAILVSKCLRWPLMIDPQNQANHWIRNKERENSLKIIKMSDIGFLRTLEFCVRVGVPILLEDLDESIDSVLESVLLKQTFSSDGKLLMRIRGKDIEYNQNFRLYMTTKLSNPHFLPEVCNKVTLINFSVTKTGLEEQILSNVFSLERPDLEEEQNKLIINIKKDKNQLNEIEDKILKTLAETKGSILDNDDLLKVLNDSKATSTAICCRITETEKTEANISINREKYRNVAARGSTLYFVVANLSLIDPMYQYSLCYFIQLFNSIVENSKKSNDLEARLENLLSETTTAVYNNVVRGLFEKDKLVFSFMLCGEILKLDNKIGAAEWNYFLLGASGIDKKRIQKPSHCKWLSDTHWKNVCDLANNLEMFKTLKDDIITKPISLKLGDLVVHLNPEDAFDKSIDRFAYTKEMSELNKLTLIKNLAEEKVVQAITKFVSNNLGQKFIQSPTIYLNSIYKDMSSRTSLVYILNNEVDPLIDFSKEMGTKNKVHSISLGQGQGRIAENLIKNAIISGEWVFLLNCHLNASWMPKLEEIVKKISDPLTSVHENFRLFMSSMPTKDFPVSVLQNSIKVTSEQPKGLRENVKRAFTNMTPSFFEENILGNEWRKIVFGICFFHAMIQERRKFGTLGFNIKYDFLDADREFTLLHFQKLCAQGLIPWDSFQYSTGEIIYGGRVTDNWDRRLMVALVSKFLSKTTMDNDYKYSNSGIYYAPKFETLKEYKDFINDLPNIDDPEVFDMNQNANISYQIQESSYLINTILNAQPRMSCKEKFNDEIVYELAEKILSLLPGKLDIETISSSMFEVDSKGRINSLAAFLYQECYRFNNLLTIIKNSLQNLKKAIEGLVVMSNELEKIYFSFLESTVPIPWKNKSYASIKPLGSWVKDLKLRCEFIENCLKNRNQVSFWFSGFFFPQGFLTSTLQTYSRKFDLPIDELSFDSQVLSQYRDQEDYATRLKTISDGEQLKEDACLKVPENGVLVHGIYMDGFSWDNENHQITESKCRELNPPLPMLHLQPKHDFSQNQNHYVCPLYKSAERRGVLSTTGHSTNFIMSISLPCAEKQDHWIRRGAALICQTTD